MAERHDLFISYATPDKKTADTICHSLEAVGLRCWIAPRDIPPGGDWPAHIPAAIKASQLMVLVFSEHANASNFVQKEVTLAVNAALPIIPFRIGEAFPEGGLELHLANVHWINAPTAPLEEPIRALAESAKTRISKAKSEPPQQRVSDSEQTIPTPQTTKQAVIDYSVDHQSAFSTLTAKVDGLSYKVIESSEEVCLAVKDVRDFDGDGYADALVEHITACGGNGALNSFFFVSYAGDGRFRRSNEFGYSAADPTTEEQDGKWTVLVRSVNEGINVDRPQDVLERYILQNGVAKKVGASEKKEVAAVCEVRSEDFDINSNEQMKTLRYDLNNDGNIEILYCSLWRRWGRLIVEIKDGNGNLITKNLPNCKRFGVLQTRTNGMHDVVCDFDDIYRWNGKDYTNAG